MCFTIFSARSRKRERERSNCLVAAEVFHPQTLAFIQEQKNKYKNDFSFEILTPIKSFDRILQENGYPIISKQVAQKLNHVRTTKNHKTYIRSILGLDNKNFGVLPLAYVHFLDKKLVDYRISHRCCDYIKGAIKHDKRPVFIGTTIQESRLRKNTWLKYGCNYVSTNSKKKSTCKPLSLWKDKDIYDFIRAKKIAISPIYQAGYTRSGCVCCMFGMSLEEQLKKRHELKMNRFELLYKTNPILFNAFVLKGPQLWKPLTDMQISLDVDNKQLKENVKKRQIALKKWYDNFAINFNRVLDEIEERNPHVWTKPERKTIFNRYLKSQRIYEAYR